MPTTCSRSSVSLIFAFQIPADADTELARGRGSEDDLIHAGGQRARKEREREGLLVTTVGIDR